MIKRVYHLFINAPQGEYLREVQDLYASLGLPGCCGSMDCTHVKWTLCPKGKKHHASGKEGYPTLVFQVAVDHNKRVLSVSQHFLGSVNDKTICENDLFSLGIKYGSLQHVEYELYDSSGTKYKCQGGYLIVDGGYIDSICFIDPDKHRLHRDSVLWSEWLESVRKDVECFFGILKSRWRFFKNGVVYHSASTMEYGFKTSCILNNLILLYDQKNESFSEEWETVDWVSLDPNVDEPDSLDDEDYDFSENIPAHVSHIQDAVIERSQIESSRPTVSTNATNNEVTVFSIDDPKSKLKEALQQSFVVQWIKQKLMWPKRFDRAQMLRMPLHKASIEIQRSLYGEESKLRARDPTTLEYTKPIGRGLFSRLGYKRDHAIVSFKGTIRSQEEYKDLCEREPIRRAYSIVFSEHGQVLDCYDQYKEGLCLASLSNSPVGCIDISTGRRAESNCRLVPDMINKTLTLKCGVNYPISNKSPKDFFIPPHTELLWHYGDSYVSYNDSH